MYASLKGDIGQWRRQLLPAMTLFQQRNNKTQNLGRNGVKKLLCIVIKYNVGDMNFV